MDHWPTASSSQTAEAVRFSHMFSCQTAESKICQDIFCSWTAESFKFCSHSVWAPVPVGAVGALGERSYFETRARRRQVGEIGVETWSWSVQLITILFVNIFINCHSLFLKTRWSPRTRMPTRMLTNRDNTYLSHFQQTHLWDTLNSHTEVTLL